jgi:hypothetical protein
VIAGLVAHAFGYAVIAILSVLALAGLGAARGAAEESTFRHAFTLVSARRAGPFGRAVVRPSATRWYYRWSGTRVPSTPTTLAGEQSSRPVTSGHRRGYPGPQ